MELDFVGNSMANIAPNIGFSALLLGATISFLLPFLVIFYRKNLDTPKISEISLALIIVKLCAFSIAQFALIYSFVVSDYSVKTVFENSHHLKPLFFKISAAWGNHQGSMLLLLIVLSVYQVAYFQLNKYNLRQKQFALGIQSGIIFLFSAYCIATSNPFLRMPFAAKNGLGLNPILQDIGLGLHPPMLYLGYLGFSLVFAHFMAAIICEDFCQKSQNLARILLSFTLGFLTLGIGLGSWWAYRELGWGGYWFWDPVENVSLMPWIAGISLLHSLKIARNDQKMMIWSIFLAIVTMILCLLGIFLTRSGVLNSVHSFAVDNQKALAMLVIIGMVGSFGLLTLALKSTKLINFADSKLSDFKKIKGEKISKKFWLIISNNYLLLISLLIILIGTIYPPIALGLFSKAVSIGSGFYNRIFIWLILPILYFLAIASNPINRYLGNKKSAKFFEFSISLFFAIILIIFCETNLEQKSISEILHYQSEFYLKICGIIMAIWGLLRNLSALFSARNCLESRCDKPDMRLFPESEAVGIKMQAELESAERNAGLSSQLEDSKQFLGISRQNLANLLIKIQASLAHLGFALLILGILLNSTYSSNKEINLKIGETFSINGLDIKFSGIDYDKGSNFIARQGIFVISANDKFLSNLRPELRYYPVSDQTTNEAAIFHNFFGKPFGDIYLVIGNQDEQNNYAVRAYFRPFIFLIWAGFFMIFFSLFALSLFLWRYRKS